MAGIRRNLLLIVFFGLAAALVGARARVLSASGSDNQPADTTLAAVMQSPQSFKGHALTFLCRFAAPGKLFRTNDPVFNNRDFTNFGIWAADAHLWEKSARGNLIPGMYVECKNTELVRTLSQARRYDLLEVTAEVVDTYANLPWMRVTALRIVPGQGYREETVAKLAEAEKMMEAGNRIGAEELFRAAATGAPESITRYAVEQIAVCMAANGKPEALADNPGQKLLETGREAARHREWAQAIALFREAGAKDCALASDADYWREFGEIYLATESNDPAHLADAEKCLTQANRLTGGTSAAILYGLARVAMAGMNLAEAEKLVTQSLQMEPDNSYARQLLLQIMSERLMRERKNGKHPASFVAAQAAGGAETAVIGSPEQARGLYVAGRLAEAESMLRTQIASSDDATVREAAALLAATLLAQGRTAEAGALLMQNRQNAARIKEEHKPQNPVSSSVKVVAEAAPVMPVAPLAVAAKAEAPELRNAEVNSAERDMRQTAQELDRLKKELDQPEAAEHVAKAEPVAVQPMVTKPVTAKPVVAPVPVPETVKPTSGKKELSLPDIPQAAPADKKGAKLPDWAL